LSTDAAVITYAEIPLIRPAGATVAFATLAARTQSEVPSAPDELIVFVMQGGKVFLAHLPAAFGSIAACDKAHQQVRKQAERARAAYEASGAKDQALADKVTRLEEEGDRAYPRCFATRARKEAGFAALVRQAQALVDALPKQ